MKHVVIIADGAADKPITELGGKTPFQAARTPNLDRLAARGRMGSAVTTPPGFEAGSDVCSMDLLGYDPARYHTGRAPLEAAALGLALKPSDWIFRLNFVTVGAEGTPDAGMMLDHSAGAISDAEARQLAVDLAARWRSADPVLAAGFSLTPGVSYRNILIDSGAGGMRDYSNVRTTPPHEIPRRPWAAHLPMVASPAGPTSAQALAGRDALLRLMSLAGEYLPSHAINRARIAAGKRPANRAWIWGQGTRPDMPLFKDRFARRGAMITPVDLLAGIAELIGWDRLKVPGLTSYHDNDYAVQGRAVCEAIGSYDIICCHVESPDEASHQGDWKTKVAAIEAIDAHVVGPVVAHLDHNHKDGWRLLVMPDHYTLVSTRKHDPTPVPWLIAGAGVRPGPEGAGRFTEPEAARGPLIDPGCSLMELFLRGTPADLETRS